MKNIECKKCKSVDFERVDNALKCIYCRTTYVDETGIGKNFLKNNTSNSTIEIDEDILLLLDKIKREPWNRNRYANMILDIDPTNEDALKMLRGMK